MKNRRAKFRLSPLEALEDRVVPSTGGTSSLQSQLSRIDAKINAAYAEFATSVRQSEMTLLPAIAGATPRGTAASVAVQVAQDAATLQGQVISAVLGQAGGNANGLFEQQLTGQSSGSLTVGLAQLLNTASAGSDGPVPGSSLPLLFRAVNGAIASSLSTTTIEIGLYVTGQSPSNITSGSSFSAAQYGSQVNAAYATFATGVRQAETTLVSPGGPTAPVGVASQVGVQINALAQSIGGALAKTPEPSYKAAIEGQLGGDAPGGLASEVSSLLVASTVGSTDGSVPASSLPLLFAAVNAAINASYNAAAVEGELLAAAAAAESKTIAELNGGGATPTLFSSYGVFFAF